MAIGDIISQVTANDNDLIYTPAVGVSVLMTAIAGTGVRAQLTDGVNTQMVTYWVNSSYNSDNAGGYKIFLTNSIYLSLDADRPAFGVGFTGIQIQ
jgi:hypothetical protein